MLVKETFREALRSLWSTKQRTLLALVGIVIGISSVIALVSIGLIIQKQTMDQFKQMGTEIISISISNRRASPGLDMGTFLKLPQACPDLVAVAPYVNINGSLSWKGKQLSGSGLGITQRLGALAKLRVQQGRNITDMDGMAPYCVLSHEMYEEIKRQGIVDPLGQKIFFNSRYLTVVGVLEKVPPSMMAPYELTDGFIIPISTALRLNKGKGVTMAMGKITSGEKWKEVQRQLSAYLGLLFPDLRVKVRSAEELIKSMQNQMRTFTIFLSAIGGIALIVGGVGVMNVMLVSVSERKREIGIRRALGAKRRDIQFQFLVESVTLCCLGGLLGVLLGEVAAYAFALYNQWDFVFSNTAILLGFGVSTMVGIFFGFYPARKASQLKPVEALRTE